MTDNHLLSIQYVFTAEAHPRDGGLPLKMRRTIDVRRSLPVPGIPRHSVRVFPPTDITASVHYDPVVHPNATSRFSLRLDGIGKHNPASRTVEYWKLKRLSWKLEENISTVAPACQKHTPKTTSGGEAGDNGNGTKKGVTRSDSRVIAQADLLSGWKADYYSTESKVEAEIEYQTGGSSSRPVSCDVRGHDGTEVSHRLVVELVVSQEYVPARSHAPSHTHGSGTHPAHELQRRDHGPRRARRQLGQRGTAHLPGCASFPTLIRAGNGPRRRRRALEPLGSVIYPHRGRLGFLRVTLSKSLAHLWT